MAGQSNIGHSYIPQNKIVTVLIMQTNIVLQTSKKGVIFGPYIENLGIA